MQTEKLLEVKSRVPKLYDGLNFLRSISVGVPYARMKLNITTRKEYQIPLTHEIVLKLIDEKWTNYDEVRMLLGVDEDYFLNILLELGASDYITHMGKQIALTEQGRKVLRELKSIKIEPDLMENVYINMLKGTIVYDENNSYSKYREKMNCNVYLNKIEDISGDFLVKREGDIRDLYTERIIGETRRSLIDDNIVRDELYRVISIEEYDIVYEEVEAHLYYGDNGFLTYTFISGNSSDDEVYYNSFKNQFKDHPKSFDRFYDTRYYYQNKEMFSQNEINIDDYDSLFSKREELSSLFSDLNIKYEKIANNYYDNRLLFYREYQDVLSNLIHKTPQEITIISDHFYDLQKSEYSLVSLFEAISSKSKVNIGFNEKNTNSLRVVDILRKKKSGNFNLKKINNINQTTIIIDNEFMIKVYYKPLFFGKEIILEETSIMVVNHDLIKEEKEKYKEFYY
ncbi:hypothetical protein [Paenibacillus tepidiphilus]|uniref:hypothetical protein n=1 Tax=Paenibacillus tepidiphilus TaxID=2608683 RepID=UPI00123A4AD6|nr:hypothetical protein [Paenibacillus tepidiphilus]